MKSLFARTLFLLFLALTSPARSDTWQERIAVNATPPSARDHQSAVWTGREMIVWGGETNGGILTNTGGRYNPAGNGWVPVTTTGAPLERYRHSAVWTGTEMLIWGGSGGGPGVFHRLTDTFSYTPGFEEFRITNVVLEGGNLLVSFPSVTGRTYTLWRSDTLADGAWTDTGLTALAGTGAALTFTVPVATPERGFFRVHADP